MQNIIALHAPAYENCIAIQNSKKFHRNAKYQCVSYSKDYKLHSVANFNHSTFACLTVSLSFLYLFDINMSLPSFFLASPNPPSKKECCN